VLKILIAEDNLMIADMAQDFLAGSGYEVCGIARTVGEAVTLARHHHPDLALIDLRLADGGLGTEIAAQLSPFVDLGILYATGNISQVRLTTDDGHACLIKPYSASDLIRGLELVSGIVANGTAMAPFPRGFHVLPSPAAGTMGATA
jgi:CheY-like chemotaxis protein